MGLMKHRWVGGSMRVGHDYRGWVMIQGAGSDEAWVGHDYNLSVSEGCRAKRDRGWVRFQIVRSDEA